MLDADDVLVVSRTIALQYIYNYIQMSIEAIIHVRDFCTLVDFFNSVVSEGMVMVVLAI